MNQHISNNIYQSLLSHKKGECTIDDQDEKMLLADIKLKLIQGWTITEILAYMSNTEYFNNIDPEEACIERMNQITQQVQNRLNTINLS